MKKYTFLTDATSVADVFHRLCVGLQLLAVKADIDPLIFHYLLVRKEREKVCFDCYDDYWCLCLYLHCVPLSHVAVKFPVHLQWAALGRVEDEEAAQDSLTVCGHVEGHAILPPQNALPQLLHTTHMRDTMRHKKMGRCGYKTDEMSMENFKGLFASCITTLR